MSANRGKRRSAGWLPMWISLGLTLAGLAFAIVRDNLSLDHTAFVVSFTSVQVVGGVLLARQPGNAIGRVMTGLGLVVATQAFVEGYAHPTGTPPELPWGGVVLTWLVAHTYIFIFVAIGLLFLLYPTGRISPRWRFVPWTMAVGVAAALSLYVKPGPLDDEADAGVANPDNPFGLDIDPGILDAVATIGALLVVGSILCSVIAMAVRFRASDGIVRLQMRWFAAASGVFAVVLAVNLILRNFFTLPAYIDVVQSIAFVLIPLAIGNAVMRYRLYEIDVFINRALVYAVLTTCVVGAYLGLVVTLQAILDSVTGDSDLAVAASTLAVAGLFQPMRRRIQTFIDRRFYRRKYDATRALGAFGARLRDEVDLDLVRFDVLGVLRETVQPAHAAVWLREQV